MEEVIMNYPKKRLGGDGISTALQNRKDGSSNISPVLFGAKPFGKWRIKSIETKPSFLLERPFHQFEVTTDDA
uniref:Uncharacterized protein n=1 Tax=Romanomermis culicivorax TaxID=13658 RepID=A0A915KQJ0_ROMCU